MALEFDAQGFLKGDPIDLGRMPGYLRDIKDDVAAIRRAVVGGGNNANTTRATRAPSPPQSRDSSGRFVAKSVAAIPTGSARSVAALSALADSIGIAEGQKKKVLSQFKQGEKRSFSTPNRAANGQFVGSGGGASSSERSMISAFISRFSGVSGIGDGVEDIDPSIKAFREVAEPMQRGLEFFKGTKDSGEAKWLRKIFGKLNIFHKESSTYDKAQLKTLKQIDEKPAGAGAVTNSSSTSFIDKIPVIGPIARAFGKTAVGAGMLGMMSKGGAFLKRIPILGSLLAAGGAAFDIYGSENDESLTRRQKDAAAGQSIGGWGGTLAGATGGAMAGAVLGPVGMIIGGVVGGFLGDQGGQIIGEKFGEWVNDLRGFDIPGKIVGAWDSAVKAFSDIWGQTKEIAGKAFDIAAEQLDGLNSYIKGNTGIDFKDMGSQWWERTKKNASDAWDVVSVVPSWMMDHSTVGKSISKLKGVVSTDGKDRTYQREDGSIETRSGGSRSWRNNNPGNIEYGDFAKKLGAIGSDGRFAIFPSLEAGRKAKEELLFNGKGYRDKTLSEAIARYAPPNENDTAGYQKSVISAAGGVDKLMSSYSVAERYAILSAIERREGFKPGAVKISSTSAPIPASPIIPSQPPIAEAPQIIQPLGSGQANRPITINLPSQDVGRDISDGRMAYIANGGIGIGG